MLSLNELYKELAYFRNAYCNAKYWDQKDFYRKCISQIQLEIKQEMANYPTIQTYSNDF